MRMLTVVLSALYGFIFCNNVHAESIEMEYLIKLVKESLGYTIPTNSNEIIKLNGIEFNTDVKNKLIELCKQENRNSRYCTIERGGEMLLGNFKYGNLVANEGEAFALVGNNGELLAYRQRGDRNSMVQLSSILKEKLGKPFERYDKSLDFRAISYWKDSSGTLLITENHGFYNKHVGAISMISSSFINSVKQAIAEANKRYEDEQKKKKQEALKNL